jgi:hypothetical protein
MSMRRMAGLLFAGGLASNADSGLCIGFPDGGPPLTGARLVQE